MQESACYEIPNMYFQMTVLDTVDGRHNKSMAKRQKTDHDDLQQEGQSDPDMPSDEMKAALLYNTRMPDMNIVEPTDTISGKY